MLTLTARFMRPHIGQEQILRSTARFKVVACGRRFGKTETGKTAIREAALRGQRCWWLTPTYQMASQFWRDIKADLAFLPSLKISETERRIDLPTGGMIAIRSTHYPDNLRGAGLDFAVLDEAAFMEPSVWPQIVRPMLLERRGAAMFLSTPFGRNWFYELYCLGQDPAEPDWAAFRFSSYDNPYISREELATFRRQTPERIFREEYLAEFIEDAGRVFRNLQEAATAPVGAQPQAGRRYVAGVDWGREHDYTAIVIIEAETRRVVAIDRFRGVGWALQRGRLVALCQRWRPALIVAEANSIGAPNIEALQAEGLPVRPFTTTAKSKRHIIERLALALERGELALLPDETLLHELATYQLERLVGGGYRYGAPVGGHDDTVMALALAWYGVLYGGAGVDFA